MRNPYVIEGDVVSYIGSAPNGYTGARIVKETHNWDGRGYPVDLWTNSYPSKIETFYDFDLVNFNRELPNRFWYNTDNVKKYPNVHTYMRVKRFGETRKQAILHLNFASTDKFLKMNSLFSIIFKT